MLVSRNNGALVQWSRGFPLEPLRYSGDVVIAIDPSKTNMAMLIGTPEGTVLDTLEFTGNGRRKGPVMDNTEYCDDFRAFVREYLSFCNLYIVAVEQAIQKKGMEHYHSSVTLLEIRSAVLSVFSDDFGIKVLEINNWAWKHAILPEGYRSPYEKGSKRYIKDFYPDSKLNNYFEADMTDCFCIFQYVISTKCTSYQLYCNRIEQSLGDYKYTIAPKDSFICDAAREVIFNDRFTLEQNLIYYSNRLLTPFSMTVNPEIFSFEQCYEKAAYFTAAPAKDEQVKVVAVRK